MKNIYRVNDYLAVFPHVIDIAPEEFSFSELYEHFKTQVLYRIENTDIGVNIGMANCSHKVINQIDDIQGLAMILAVKTMEYQGKVNKDRKSVV